MGNLLSPLQIGDRVCVRHGITPWFGPQGVQLEGNVGTLVEIDNTTSQQCCHVQFSGDRLFQCLLHELIPGIDEFGTRVTFASSRAAKAHAILDGNLQTHWSPSTKFWRRAKEGGRHRLVVEVPHASHLCYAEVFVPRTTSETTKGAAFQIHVSTGDDPTNLAELCVTGDIVEGWNTLFEHRTFGRFLCLDIRSHAAVVPQIGALQLEAEVNGKRCITPSHTLRAEEILARDRDGVAPMVVVKAEPMEAEPASFTAGDDSANDDEDDDSRHEVHCPTVFDVITVGSVVRVAKHFSPNRERDGIRAGRVGVVHRRRVDGVWLVAFPGIDGYWKAKLADLERAIDSSQARVSASSNSKKASMSNSKKAAVLLSGNEHWCWKSESDTKNQWIQIDLPSRVKVVDAVEIKFPRHCSLPGQLRISVGETAGNLRVSNKVNLPTGDAVEWIGCLRGSQIGHVVKIHLDNYKGSQPLQVSAIRARCITDTGEMVFIPNHTAREGYFSPTPWRPTGDPPPKPDARLLRGQYLQLTKLGAGGFGEAWLGIDFLQRFNKCVIKILHQVEPFAIRLMEHEAYCLHRLRHPSIPALYAHFNVPEDGQYVVVMEHIPGNNFHRHVELHGPLSDGVVRDIAFQMRSILLLLESERMIHRDIKPENVIWCDERRVVLIDFGIAASLGHTFARANTCIGTDGYMAPEVGNAGSSFVADYYSLGGLLLYLLSGQNPRAPNRARIANLRCSAKLRDLISTLLCEDEHQRRRGLNMAFELLAQDQAVHFPTYRFPDNTAPQALWV